MWRMWELVEKWGRRRRRWENFSWRGKSRQRNFLQISLIPPHRAWRASHTAVLRCLLIACCCCFSFDFFLFRSCHDSPLSSSPYRSRSTFRLSSLVSCQCRHRICILQLSSKELFLFVCTELSLVKDSLFSLFCIWLVLLILSISVIGESLSFISSTSLMYAKLSLDVMLHEHWTRLSARNITHNTPANDEVAVQIYHSVRHVDRDKREREKMENLREQICLSKQILTDWPRPQPDILQLAAIESMTTTTEEYQTEKIKNCRLTLMLS